MRRHILKTAGYFHSILVLTVILAPVYGIGLLTEGQTFYGVYWLGIWIALPVIITGIAVGRCRRVSVYFLLVLLSSAGMLLAVWAMGRLLLTFDILYLLLGLLLIEALTVGLDHLRVRLALTRARKDGSVHDPSWIPPRSVFERPSPGGFILFGIIYALGLFISSSVICNVALVEGICYFFLYLLYRYVSVTEEYFRLQHRVKNIPARRVYGITGGVLGILAVLMAATAVLSVLMIPQRNYVDFKNFSLGSGDITLEDQMLMPPTRLEGPEELTGGEYQEPQPMPGWLETLLQVLGAALLLTVCILAVRGIWRYLRVFRESQEENGDLVEELVERDQGEERLPAFRESVPKSERERIRRLYRRTIRKYRKEQPGRSETPLEIEQAAGIDRLEEIQRLHRRYEQARYGEQGSTESTKLFDKNS